MFDSTKGNRGTFVVGVFTLAVAGLIFALAFQAGQLNGEAIGRNEIDVIDCFGLEPARMVECVKATSEEQRAQQDLAAQRQMSLWTFGMFVVSVVTAIITGLGVWFVKGTLGATMMAVKETSAATATMKEANVLIQSEQRPWLRINARAEFKLHHELGPLVNIIMTRTNVGAKPANHCRWWHIRSNPIKQPKGFVRDQMLEAERKAKGFANEGFLFPGETTPGGYSEQINLRGRSGTVFEGFACAAPYKLGGTLHERSTVAYFIVTIMLTGSCKSYEDVKSASDIRIRIDQNNGYAQ